MPNIIYKAVNMYPKQRAAFDASLHVMYLLKALPNRVKLLAPLIGNFVSGQMIEGAAEHWWVAPVYGQANIAFARVKRMFHLLIRAKLNTDK